MEINEKQKTIILPKIHDYFNGSLKGKQFAIWGLAFKPDTDDIREAPALYIIDELLNCGASVRAYDPEAIPNVKMLLGDKIQYAANPYDAAAGADALIICTEWGLFRTPDFERLNMSLKEKVIFDGRNLYSLNQMKELDYYYSSIGRSTIERSTK
jgi:UDPglucose 6-dehydrogenase